jgi:hypothetical protein
MQSVMFIVKPEVLLKEWKSVLKNLKTWTGVEDAAPLKPGAKNPTLRRIFYLYLTDDANVNAIVGKLRDLPQVESAEAPAERRLIVGSAGAAV